MNDADGLLFSALRVLDVGTWIAGPVAATILADFGASVIKVEVPGTGDPYRQLPAVPMMPKSELNYSWLADARNKRGITLNLKSEEGRAILLRLVRECDVFVTNQPLPARRAFGLTYADLAPLNARMIYASLTAYGETGPDADLEGFDGVAWWARSGLMDLVRAPGATPGGSVPGMGDHPTAVALYAGIVTALLRRERTGAGSEVHTSLLANGVWSNLCLAQAAFVGADFSARRAPPAAAPSPNRLLYETADGRLLQLYMVRTAEELDRLLLAAGREDILADPRFADQEARTEHGAALVALLQDLFRTRPAQEWMQLFRAAAVPVSLVTMVEELPEDEQLRAIEAVTRPADDPVSGPLIINHPVNVRDLARVGPKPAPEIGEHTDEVLAELGFDAAEIAGLRNRGAV